MFLGVVPVHEYHYEADYADALWWYSIQCLGVQKSQKVAWLFFAKWETTK